MGSEWREVRLEEVAELRNGAGIKQTCFSPVGHPLVRVSNFTDGSVDLKDCIRVAPEWVDAWRSHFLRSDDILVATVGSWPPNWSSVVGKTVSVPAAAAGAIQNQNTCAVSARTDRAHQRFLYYRLRSLDFLLYGANQASGSASQARIPVSALKNFTFLLPPLSKQRAIAGVLGSLDDKIALNRRMNRTLESMARALFKSWFVDFDPVHANAAGQPSLPPDLAALFPAAFESSALGEVPVGWEVRKLECVAEISGGKQLNREAYVDGGRHIVYGANGAMGTTDQTTHEGFVIVFGRVGANCGAIRWRLDGAWINNNASAIVPSETPAYVLQVLKSIDFVPFRKGSAQPFISNSSLGTVKVFWPDEGAREAFCTVADDLRKRQIANEEQSRTLVALRDALLPKLLSGELSVTDAAAEEVANTC